MSGDRRTTRCRHRGYVWIAVIALVAGPASGNINLEWRPAAQTVAVGATVELGLYAVSDSAEDQLLSAVELVFSWDPAHLHLLGLDQTGAVALFYSGFPTTGDCGLNEVVPPQDGDGLYRAWAPLGSPVAGTPNGTLLTTFRFEALLGTVNPTVLVMLSSNGACRTVVVDGVIPGLDVTGELGTATVTVGCAISADCDDGVFCNGQETCAGGSCLAGSDPCPGQWCDEENDVCVDCPSLGDFDDDCDVDLDDYTDFADCMNGPDTPPAPSQTTVQQCLDAFDSEDDGDVDLNDFATFQEAFTGER